jgi:hypothetical protein
VVDRDLELEALSAFGCAGYCDKPSIWQLEHHLRG